MRGEGQRWESGVRVCESEECEDEIERRRKRKSERESERASEREREKKRAGHSQPGVWWSWW